jgi:membrane protein
VRLIAIGMTLGFTILVILALTLLLYGNRIGDLVTVYFGLGGVFHAVWSSVEWPLVLFFVLVAFAVIFRFAPDLEGLKWQWITPGTVTGLNLWLLVSFSFRIYLGHFNSYNRVYGSLGAVIILLLWLWLTGIALLEGAEVNSVIEDAAAASGQPEAHPKGHKQPRAA